MHQERPSNDCTGSVRDMQAWGSRKVAASQKTAEFLWESWNLRAHSSLTVRSQNIYKERCSNSFLQLLSQVSTNLVACHTKLLFSDPGGQKSKIKVLPGLKSTWSFQERTCFLAFSNLWSPTVFVGCWSLLPITLTSCFHLHISCFLALTSPSPSYKDPCVYIVLP